MDHFNSLPDEMILEIFQHWDFTKLKLPDLQFVCKRFYSLCRHPSLLKELRVSSFEDRKVVLKAVNQRPSIKTLAIVDLDYGFYAEEYEILLDKGNITKNQVFGRIYACGAPHLLDRQVGPLMELDIFKTYGTFPPNTQNFLSNVESLITGPIQDHDLITIANCCQNLKYFAVKGNFSDAAYQVFCGKVKSTLTTLTVVACGINETDCGNFSSGALDALTQCGNLVELEITADCASLELNRISKKKLPSLKTIRIEDSYYKRPGKFMNPQNWFKDHNFSQLLTLSLNIRKYDGHDDDPLILDILYNCPNLRDLEVNGSLFGSDENLLLLSELKHLLYLTFTLSDCPDDLSFQVLLQMLESLEIGVTKIKKIELVGANLWVDDDEWLNLTGEEIDSEGLYGDKYLEEVAAKRGVELSFS